jgi:RNA polymerase sigma-70 factor (family 1)
MEERELQLNTGQRSVGIEKQEFKEIFDALYDPIKNFIYYKTSDIELAEDIAQETFLKVWEKRDTVKKETIKPFLYTIANNIFINKIQQNKVNFKFVNSQKSKNHVESPEYELEMKEFDKKLQNTLSMLSEKNRVVFLMNRIDGMTYAEIAKNIGISVKAVEKRMQNSLAYLRKQIEIKF